MPIPAIVCFNFHRQSATEKNHQESTSVGSGNPPSKLTVQIATGETVKPCSWLFLKIEYSPENQHVPESQWLEDVLPTEIVPF